MSRWWTGVALAAGSLLTPGGAARAQYSPTPAAPPRLPEPVPQAALAPPGLAPGAAPGAPPGMPLPPGVPVAPGLPPGVPGAPGVVVAPGAVLPGAPPACLPEGLSVPAGPGAFECLPTEQAVYLHLGAQGWNRMKLGKGLVAVQDPNFLDTGTPASRNFSTAERLNDLTPDMGWGIRGSFGYLDGNQGIEVTGFYVPDNRNAIEQRRSGRQGRLDALFFNPPVGFEGDTGLWQQADIVRSKLTTTLGDLEINYRYSDAATTGAELIFGVRYLDFKDRLDIFTDDDGLTVLDANGNPDPTRQATYTVQAHNRIVAPQLGFECGHPICQGLSIALQAKGAWGANFLDRTVRLDRGDGFNGFVTQTHNTYFSHLYEFGAFFDVALMERCRLRAGYNCMWLLQVGVAQDQIDFNLANTEGVKNHNGSVFYHGPTLEFQFLF